MSTLLAGVLIVAGFTDDIGTNAADAVIAKEADAAGGSEGNDGEFIKEGDVVLGVCGVCTLGLSPASLDAAIAAARATIPGGSVVLHLADVAFDASLLEECTLQMASAAAELLGSREAVERAQAAVYEHVVAPPRAAAADA